MHTHTHTHEISFDRIDEHGGPDVAFAAFCECGWRGDWQHADSQVGYPAPDAFDQAQAEAEDDGDDHLAQVGAETAPDLGAFRALAGPPALDPSGYAAADRRPS